MDGLCRDGVFCRLPTLALAGGDHPIRLTRLGRPFVLSGLCEFLTLGSGLHSCGRGANTLPSPQTSRTAQTGRPPQRTRLAKGESRLRPLLGPTVSA